jgi:multiple sugar transport system permease protein
MTTTIAPPPSALEAPAGAPPPPVGRRGTGRGIGLHVAVVAGLLLMVAPFLWMLFGSFKSTTELRRVPPTWLPADPTVANYQDLWDRLDFPRFFFNSAVVAVTVTAAILLLCSMVGYALAKLEFPGRRILFPILLGTMMIPVFVTFMPLFVLVANLELVNTHLGLILPQIALSGAFGVFLMRQFISGIPDELLDAARVDGAGEYRIFFRVIVPLSGPALATLGIVTFMGTWNSFLWPLVVASTEEMYTLPVALALFAVGQQESNLGLQLAGAVVVVLPILILFFALQRYVIQGIATTGIK